MLDNLKFWAARSRVAQELRDLPLHFRVRESYAQHGEDLFLVNTVFKNHHGVGRYLDIGASHPVRISNTYLLYRRGWTGIVVEPIQRLARLHRRWRPRDRQVECLVGDADGAAEFFLMYPSVLSTVSREHYERLVKAGHRLVERLWIPQYTLQTLLDRHGGAGRIDFVSVDIEGLDWIVASQVATMDPSLLPRCLCIESNDEDANTKVTGLLADTYRNAERIGVNTIFWNEE